MCCLSSVQFSILWSDGAESSRLGLVLTEQTETLKVKQCLTNVISVNVVPLIVFVKT